MPDAEAVENSSKLLHHLLARGDKTGSGTISPAHFRKVLRGCGVHEGIEQVVAAFGSCPRNAPSSPNHGMGATQVDYGRFVEMFRASQLRRDNRPEPLPVTTHTNPNTTRAAKTPPWRSQAHIVQPPFGTDLQRPTSPSPRGRMAVGATTGMPSDVACLSQNPWSPRRVDPPASPRGRRPGAAEGETSLLGGVLVEPAKRRAQTPTPQSGAGRGGGERLAGRRHSFDPSNRNFRPRQVFQEADDSGAEPLSPSPRFLGSPRRHVPVPRGDPKRNPINAESLPGFSPRGRRHSSSASAVGVETPVFRLSGKARYPSPYRSDGPTDTLGQSGLRYQWWPSREADRGV